DRARHLPVGVDDVGHVRVVVVIVDDGGVDDGIAAIDIFEISASPRVGGPRDTARTEREPGDTADVAAGDRDLEVAAADECNERRSVIRPRAHRAGYPAPRSIEIRPATVVRYGEAPRRVIHPRPTPRVDPRPMTIAVRRPAGGDAIRVPDVAVGRVVAPRAVRIEVLVAN